MIQRIGKAEIEVLDIEKNVGNTLRNDWRGELIIDDKKETFHTNVNDLQAGLNYDVVYERTETITGESILKIHQITKGQNYESGSSP